MISRSPLKGTRLNPVELVVIRWITPLLLMVFGSWSVSLFCHGLEQTVKLTTQRSLSLSLHQLRDLQTAALSQAEASFIQSVTADRPPLPIVLKQDAILGTLAVDDQPSTSQAEKDDFNLILQCLGPEICKIAGARYYFDPYANKCVRPSLLASVKGAKPPQFPELEAACALGVKFSDFQRGKGGSAFDDTSGG